MTQARRGAGSGSGDGSDSSQSVRSVPEGVGGQDQGMRRRLTPDPDDVDLRDQSAQDEAPQEESAAVANPRRTRR